MNNGRYIRHKYNKDWIKPVERGGMICENSDSDSERAVWIKLSIPARFHHRHFTE